MASMAWVFLQSRRPVLSMIRVIIIIMLIIIISPYSSDKIHIRCYIEILRNKCKVQLYQFQVKKKNTMYYCKIKYLHNWVIVKINLLKKLSNTFIQVNSKKIQKSNIYTARSYLRLTCSKIYFWKVQYLFYFLLWIHF